MTGEVLETKQLKMNTSGFQMNLYVVVLSIHKNPQESTWNMFLHSEAILVAGPLCLHQLIIQTTIIIKTHL